MISPLFALRFIKRALPCSAVLVGLLAAAVKPAAAAPPGPDASQSRPVQTVVPPQSTASCSRSSYAVDPADSGRRSSNGHTVMPPNDNGPTVVDVGLYVMEIPEISVLGNYFRLEGFVDLIWCDPRLAFDAEAAGVDREIYLERDVPGMLQDIWWPDYTFVNEVGNRAIENEELIIYPDGTVHYEERLNVLLAANYDLHRFPFDTQTLPIMIESYAWDSDYLLFNQQLDKVGFSTEFEIAEWHTESVRSELGERQEIRDPIPFSSMLVELDVSRHFGFYIWKAVVPLLLMVAIAFTVFWLSDEGLPTRMSIALTGLLTIVAYQFVIAGSIPRVSYLTLMDAFLVLCIAMIGLTIFESVAVYLMTKREKTAQAARLDRICRLAFPLSAFVGLILLFSFYTA